MNQRNSNNKREGYWEVYHFENKLWFTGTFVDGKKNGYFKWYYHGNGQLYREGNYFEDKKIGYWVYYDKNGITAQKYFL